MPAKTTANGRSQPLRSQLGPARANNYLTSAYRELTSSENASVVRSLVMFGVSLPVYAMLQSCHILSIVSFPLLLAARNTVEAGTRVERERRVERTSEQINAVFIAMLTLCPPGCRDISILELRRDLVARLLSRLMCEKRRPSKSRTQGNRASFQGEYDLELFNNPSIYQEV